VQERNLYFVPGEEWKFEPQMERMGGRCYSNRASRLLLNSLAAARSDGHSGLAGAPLQKRGGIVKRNFLILGMAILGVAGALLAQDEPAKTPPKKTIGHGSAGSAVKGKDVFTQKCAMCHFAESDAKKIGPGLKGMSKRGTFTVNGNKVTDEALKTWIENGDTMMPPFKDVLEPAQIKDVIAYVKTL
jgi:cytochrome c